MFSTTAEQIRHVRSAEPEKKIDYLLDHIAIGDLVQRYGARHRHA